jgi:hypothetical protein
MELEEILKRLRNTIDLSKTLKDEQFNYSSYVTEFDKENKCGTVCCIVGHYPNWNIKGFKYSDIYGSMYNTLDNLTKYHGLSKYLNEFLFYGIDFEGTFTDEIIQHNDLSKYSLKEVIERFETVYELLENKNITPNWNEYE